MTTRHPYGPHRPEAAPNSVTILAPAIRSCGASSCGAGFGHRLSCVVLRYPQPEIRPIPSALVRQRAQLNTRAHLEAWAQ